MAEENEEVIFDDVIEDDNPAFVENNNEDNDLNSPEEQEILAQLRQIESLADMSPEIRDSDEYKNLKSTLDKVRGQEPEAGDEEEEEEEDEELEEKPNKNGDDSNESDIFGLGSTNEDDELEFEIDEDMASFISDHYGLSDVSSFFDKVDTWRNQAQSGSQAQNEYDDILDGIKSLPPEIKQAIEAYSNGDNFHDAFNSTGGRLDFDKEYKNQDKELIVKHYFTEDLKKLQTKVDNGELDDVDMEDRVDLLYNSAKRLYSADQKMFSERRADVLEEQEGFQENFKTSVSSSVETLKEQYPNFSNKELQKVRQRLVDGNIESMFHDKDGTYTGEAAKMIAFAMYGEDVMQNLLEKTKLRGESEANEKLVNRSNKKPRASSTQRKNETEAIDSISHLTGEFKDDPYA